MIIGVSLKLYFDVAATLAWCDDVKRVADRESVRSGRIRLWVAPSLPAVPLVLDRFRGTGVEVGAQDLSPFDRGPYTGGVSGADLRELGCRYAVVGHAERFAIFGDDRRSVAWKTAAALRNDLIPVVCVGEAERGPAGAAARECLTQLDAAGIGEVVVAYEPVWAIGAGEPAEPDHVGAVCAALRERGHPVIYGGSAGPGLLTRLGDRVDGLFLGRFAHDPARLAAVLDEAERL